MQDTTDKHAAYGRGFAEGVERVQALLEQASTELVAAADAHGANPSSLTFLIRSRAEGRRDAILQALNAIGG